MVPLATARRRGVSNARAAGRGFAAAVLPTILAFILVPALTIIIGMLMSRDAVRQPPMTVLRAEAT